MYLHMGPGAAGGASRCEATEEFDGAGPEAAAVEDEEEEEAAAALAPVPALVPALALGPGDMAAAKEGLPVLLGEWIAGRSGGPELERSIDKRAMPSAERKQTNKRKRTCN